MIRQYVQGINAYIAKAITDPALLPVEYALFGPPKPWTPADVVAVAGLIGGIFGDGGGGEVPTPALLRYLQGQLGQPAGATAFTDFKEQNDPAAPTTVVDKSFPYEIPGHVNPATIAIPDNPGAPLKGGPADTTPGCSAAAPSKAGLSVIESLLRFPAQMSNALVVGASHSADGHPLAVFGPRCPTSPRGILMQEDLHSPQLRRRGRVLPRHRLHRTGPRRRLRLVGHVRGQRPHRPAPGADLQPATAARCRRRARSTCSRASASSMVNEQFPDGPSAGGARPQDPPDRARRRPGLDHRLGGKPVAVVNQRSTYNHDVDSVIGFLRFGEPALTHSAKSWMVARRPDRLHVQLVLRRQQGHRLLRQRPGPGAPLGRRPQPAHLGHRQGRVAGLPAGVKHVHEIDPPQGFFDSWNNKPAPLFSASDGEYGYGPVYRVQMLTAQIRHQFALHHGKITRADLVQAMETAASQDLDGLTILLALLRAVHGRHEPAGVDQMLAALRAWHATGAHRLLAAPSDAQYEQADAVAIMDQLTPAVIKAIFDPLFAAGGSNSGRVQRLPDGLCQRAVQRRRPPRQRLRRRLGGLHGQSPGPVSPAPASPSRSVPG